MFDNYSESFLYVKKDINILQIHLLYLTLFFLGQRFIHKIMQKVLPLKLLNSTNRTTLFIK
jgi:hypothetical protein